MCAKSIWPKSKTVDPPIKATGRRIGFSGEPIWSYTLPSMLARHSFRQIPLRAPCAVLKHSISSKATVTPKSITLSLVVPPSLKPELWDFESVEEIKDLIKSQRAILRGPSSKNPGHYTTIPPRQYSTLSPSITYEVLTPGWAGYQGEYHHMQVSDKAFEDKSRLALIANMEKQGLKFRELDRIITGPANTVAEWEGIFDVFPDRLFLLECKHSVSGVHLSSVVLY